LLGILAFDREQYHIVIKKNHTFICKIAHRAIVNIHYVGQMKLLENMWCNGTLFLDQRHFLDQVTTIISYFFFSYSYKVFVYVFAIKV
jgi:hypothetical protein